MVTRIVTMVVMMVMVVRGGATPDHHHPDPFSYTHHHLDPHHPSHGTHLSALHSSPLIHDPHHSTPIHGPIHSTPIHDPHLTPIHDPHHSTHHDPIHSTIHDPHSSLSLLDPHHSTPHDPHHSTHHDPIHSTIHDPHSSLSLLDPHHSTPHDPHHSTHHDPIHSTIHDPHSSLSLLDPHHSTLHDPQHSTALHDSHHSHERKYEKRPSNFGYSVKDDYHGTEYSRHETSDSKGTTGHYQVQLPDGRLQTVIYHANDDGYHAKVLYDGEPQHPPPRTHHQHHPVNHHHTTTANLKNHHPVITTDHQDLNHHQNHHIATSTRADHGHSKPIPNDHLDHFSIPTHGKKEFPTLYRSDHNLLRLSSKSKHNPNHHNHKNAFHVTSAAPPIHHSTPKGHFHHTTASPIPNTIHISTTKPHHHSTPSPIHASTPSHLHQHQHHGRHQGVVEGLTTTSTLFGGQLNHPHQPSNLHNTHIQPNGDLLLSPPASLAQFGSARQFDIRSNLIPQPSSPVPVIVKSDDSAPSPRPQHSSRPQERQVRQEEDPSLPLFTPSIFVSTRSGDSKSGREVSPAPRITPHGHATPKKDVNEETRNESGFRSATPRVSPAPRITFKGESRA
ncbi:histidine-rich glycoprotein-like [Eriocheir sinensis]|uniref:histidine-rich glycoprotein-like n=1 Tax=Eriocheir sinensis TaxID=95602 RepID=UPI0021C7F558|nr:histidine-rich glycoprotein-like [Eriocheir sinensis]XP_050730613.1 histidine-rich glycoprotein-like [Eriocheir sinensis]